jgi:hypothetical protein
VSFSNPLNLANDFSPQLANYNFSCPLKFKPFTKEEANFIINRLMVNVFIPIDMMHASWVFGRYDSN